LAYFDKKDNKKTKKKNKRDKTKEKTKKYTEKELTNYFIYIHVYNIFFIYTYPVTVYTGVTK